MHTRIETIAIFSLTSFDPMSDLFELNARGFMKPHQPPLVSLVWSRSKSRAHHVAAVPIQSEARVKLG